MITLMHLSPLAISLIGYLATAYLISRTPGFDSAQRRALFVSGLVVWTIAGLGALVHDQTIGADLATAFGGGACMMFALCMIAPHYWQHWARKRTKSPVSHRASDQR